jgi:WD40 repeat protein
VLSGLKNAGGSVWSPDGRWLVLPLEPEHGKEGLWLVHVATGKRFLVLEGKQFGGTAWLPDGRTLVTAVGIFSNLPYATETYGKSEVGLYVFRLPNLTKLGVS